MFWNPDNNEKNKDLLNLKDIKKLFSILKPVNSIGSYVPRSEFFYSNQDLK